MDYVVVGGEWDPKAGDTSDDMDSTDIVRLVGRVKKLMDKGWKPQGGVTHQGNGSFVQAMVKD
jgi:hypothetical protein